jgi:NAD-dependent deacetylase sirtuin 4
MGSPHLNANSLSGSSDAMPAFDALLSLLEGRSVAVLAGAGCSTESGIPDYRGPNGSLRRRQPMQYKEFTGSPEGRARYWSRSVVGWPTFASAAPNAAHRALAELERHGLVTGLITQNVDGLHHAAGSRAVVELHGSLARVRCLACDRLVSRADVQRQLVSLNREWLGALGRRSGSPVRSAPDGDAELSPEAAAGFRVPECASCGGLLKPDVVFFGESVPKARVDAAWDQLARADVLLVVGSSLSVYSGRRFLYRARETGVPIAIVNVGPTRGDALARVKVEERLGTALPRVLARLESRREPSVGAPTAK